MSIKQILSRSIFMPLFFVIIIAGVLWRSVPEVSGAPSPIPAGSVVVTGYAWSDNIGWLNFNPAFGGVFYNNTTGQLSGYAWSDNVGWIYFGPDKSNISASTAPNNPKQWAKANITTGLVSGWAKAYRAIPDKTDINAEDSQTLGGWGGWIKMDHGRSNPVSIDLNKSSPNYGDFSGYAWESDVVGWIKFNCSDTPGECAKSNYKVRAILPGAPLDVSCFADPNPANIGDGVVFTATPSGGVAPYSYKWTGGVSGVGKEFTTSFSTAGTKTANVEVKDNLGKTATNSCSVEVVYNPNEGLCDTVENQCIVGNFVDVADSNTQYLWNCVGSLTTDNCALNKDEITAWITADPDSVNKGEKTLISWNSTNATSCIPLEGGDDASWKIFKTNTSGDFETSAFGASDRTYEIQCKNEIKSVSDSVKVSIAEPKKLTVTVVGNKMPTNDVVTSDDGLIKCEGFCEGNYNLNTEVTLTAKPKANYIFKGWSDDCLGVDETCALTMDEDKDVTATFIKEGDIDIIVSNITATIVNGLPTNSDYDAKSPNLSIESLYCDGSTFNLTADYDGKGDVVVIDSSGGTFELINGQALSLPYHGNLVVKNIPGDTMEKRYSIILTASCINSGTSKMMSISATIEVGKKADTNLIIKKTLSNWEEL